MKSLPIVLLIVLIGSGCKQDTDKTETTGTFTDSRDNHAYKWIKIGSQTWMAENLAYLPSVSSSSEGSSSMPYFYVYGYNGDDVASAKVTANFENYGVLYNCQAAAGACPDGWHLPSNDEWNVLFDLLGSDAIKHLKSISGWSEGANGDNSSGFNALPAGNCDSAFYYLGVDAYFWSASINGSSSYVWLMGLNNNFGGPGYDGRSAYGFSVRCIKGK